MLLQLTIITTCILQLADGHGRLVEPPSRASMWRLGFDTPPNYNDNQMFCGGFSTQYNKFNKGRCGVCGDEFNGTRHNEVGGEFATGTIGRRYEVGQEIQTLVHITANHKGFFQFKLCQNDDPNKKVEQDCFDKHVLENRNGETKLHIGTTPMCFSHTLKLPDGVSCSACILQWRYHTGNSWGEDAVTGQSGIGFGNQEEFYGCADIAIGRPVTPAPQTKQYTLCPADGQSGGGGYLTFKPMDPSNKYTTSANPMTTSQNGGNTCNCPCALNAATDVRVQSFSFLLSVICFISMFNM